MPAALHISPGALWRWGLAALVAGLGLGLLLVWYLVWTMPDALPVIPVLLVGGVAAWKLFQYPTLNLMVLLCSIVLVLANAPGIQLTEALFGMYFLAYLGHWVFTRRVLRGERLLHEPEDKALFLFLLGATLSAAMTLLFGGTLRALFSEWIALLLLAFYFPVKALVVRHRWGAVLIVLVLVWMGFFVATRNMLIYRTILSNASYAFQITRGRVILNDAVLMMASIFGLLLLLYARDLRYRAVLLGFFLLVFGALILTLSRGYWVSFSLGAFVLLLALPWAFKKRLVTLGVLGFAAFLSIGLLFFGDYVVLVFGGLIERLLSLGSATTRDLSLMSRFVEARAALEHIKLNPLLGHGMAVPYQYFDIITHTTVERTFIHNGYVSLLYRFGLWGLGLILFTWTAAVYRGLWAYRRRGDVVARLGGLAAAATLVAFLLSANTSNPFFLNDSLFMFALLMGLASGAAVRLRRGHGEMEQRQA